MFLFELCSLLGVRHPEYLDLSCRQVQDWLAYYRIRPWGEQAADLRAGIVSSTIVNANPYRKRSARPARPSDFMPFLTDRDMTPAQIDAVITSALRV